MSNLKEIKTALSNLTALVDQLEKTENSVLTIPATKIELQPGERLAGLMLDDEGKPSYYLILLPGEEKVDWNGAKEMAAKAGADLPTRREQSLLFANLKGEFQETWYWSGEQCSEFHAWYQHFYYGTQGSRDEKYEGRARLVRRFVLQSFNPSVV